MIEIDKILVGKFGSPVGLNGEIKVIMMTSTFEVFKNLKHYINFDETIKWNFSTISFRTNKCVVKLDSYSSYEDVLKIKGQKIYSYKKYFPETRENEYYVSDLIGCKFLILENNNTGEVTDIKNYGAGDIFEVNLNDKNYLIPFNKENIISVDLKNREITANPISGILDY
ncbi:ribosome maturation factor RimM [Pelagibacteraceae bacterium]|nr:ribosome maturation factor RimM [Pelagibacteraceae bacterium]